jgi:hypothetical protein
MTIGAWWDARTARERWICIVSSVVVLLGLLLGRAVPATAEWITEQREAAESSGQRLATMRASLENEQTLRATLVAARRWALTLDSSLAMRVPRATAEARLLADVSAIAAEANVSVSSAQVVATPIGDSRERRSGARNLERIVIRVTGHGDTESLIEFLAALDTTRQVLSVRSLAINAGALSGRPQMQSAPLQFDMQVASLARLDAVPTRSGRTQ